MGPMVFLQLFDALVNCHGVDEQTRSGPSRASLGKFVAATDHPGHRDTREHPGRMSVGTLTAGP